MKKSLYALALLAASVCAVAASTARDTAVFCVAAARSSWRWLSDLVLAPFKVAGDAVVKNLPGPAVALIAAKLYQLRQIKREKPQLSPSWRMCPSA